MSYDLTVGELLDYINEHNITRESFVYVNLDYLSSEGPDTVIRHATDMNMLVITRRRSRDERRDERTISRIIEVLRDEDMLPESEEY